MAGKWYLSHGAIRFVLGRGRTMGVHLKKLGLSLWLGLFLSGLLLTSTAVPVLSKTGVFQGFQSHGLGEQKDISKHQENQLVQHVDGVLETARTGRDFWEDGRQALQQGQASLALEAWRAAEDYYQNLDDGSGVLRSQLLQTEALRKLGLYPQACGLLVQIIDFQSVDGSEVFMPQQLCQNQEITEVLLDSTGSSFQEQSDRFKASALRSLGVVLRGLGRLDESEVVLSNEFGANDAATLLSLGNTLRAKGNLVRDRITSPNYDAMPWRFEKLTSLDEDDINGVKEALSDCAISQINKDEGITCKAQINHEDESYAKVAAFYQTAKNHYQQATQLSHSNLSRSLEVKAQLNQLAILSELMRLSSNSQDIVLKSEAEGLISQITGNLDTLPNGQDRIFAQLNLAKQWSFLQGYIGNSGKLNQVEALLCKADQDAISLISEHPANACQSITDPVEDTPDNAHIRSYTLGGLGGFYEYRAWLTERGTHGSKQHTKADNLRKQAIAFTEQALILAQPADTPDVAYQWQWQLGRLRAKQSRREDAIANYEQALETLSNIRGDLIGTTRITKFSFRDNVEPVYRQLIDLKLQAQQPSQADLKDAVNLVDFLQIAELENFFNCNLSQVAKLDQQIIDETAAVIYPIFLKDRLSVVLSTPDGKFHYHVSSLNILHPTAGPITLKHIIQRFERFLKRPSHFRKTQMEGSIIYNSIFRPFEKKGVITKFPELSYQDKSNTDFVSNFIKTMVFVPDGELRNIPMAALWDDESHQFLIEKYAVAVAPGLKLLTAQRLPNNASILIGGSSEQLINPLTNKPFPKLKNVSEEKNAIETQFSSRKVVIFNQDFTQANLKENLRKKDFNILHFATHGQFSSDPKKTFITLSDGALYAEELDNLISLQESKGNEIQLLALSACSTADGDRHAILGMAGLTIRSGSRSTLATLWPVYDNTASQLMQHFYKDIVSEQGISKAKALQNAQIHAIQNLPNKRDNTEWAPFILVGNWL